MVIILWVHVVAILIYSLARGESLSHSALEASIVAAPALVGTVLRSGRRLRSGAVSFGLLSASAVLVHLSGGLIELHFHFFVMVPLIALYQDWFPFTAAIGFVLLHHGAVGVLDPQSVYNHFAAWQRPVLWAGIHAFFIAGTTAVCLVTWRLNEAAMEKEAQAAEQARNTLGVLAATLESTADGILVVDDRGRMTHFNHRFVEMWRIPEGLANDRDDDEVLAFVLDQLVDPDGFLEQVRTLYGSTATSSDELEFTDGRVFERYSQPLRLDGGTAGRVWSFRDITERKQTERTLRDALAKDREAVERLAALDESKNLLLTAVSHELRTPLTSVVGYAEMLVAKDAQLSSEQRLGHLRRLLHNSQRLQALVLNLFDLDRISRGIVEPRREAVELNALARRVIDGLDIGTRRVDVTADDVWIDVDVGMTERIVENLVANAAKYTPPEAAIDVVLSETPEGAILEVRDRGAGVCDELKEAIFEPFRQGTTVSHTPGTGIGLSLVARFAELHGGRAWVEDRPGGGSVFKAFLAPGARVPASLQGA